MIAIVHFQWRMPCQCAWQPAHMVHRMQGRASNPALDDRECVALFREHVDEMHKRAVASFTDLLDEARAAL